MITTIISRGKRTLDADIDLRFKGSRARMRYSDNSIEFVEKGIKRYINKELGKLR